MTRTMALLQALGASRAQGFRALVELVGVLLVLPFVIVVDLGRVVRLSRARQALDRLDAISCPCGSRPIPLSGAFTCGACGVVYRGRATTCPACRSEANLLRCPCGVSVPLSTNPVSRAPRRWQ